MNETSLKRTAPGSFHCAAFLQRGDIILEEVFELPVGEHLVDKLEDGLLIVLVELLAKLIGELKGMTVGEYLSVIGKSSTGLAQFTGPADTMALAEHHIYGSSRIGLQTYARGGVYNVWQEGRGLYRADLNAKRPWYSGALNDLVDSMQTVAYGHVDVSGGQRPSRTVGLRYYELSDHLGNVLATVLDRKTGVAAYAGSNTYISWKADVATLTDYYPFGMPMPGRSWERGMGSKFGFNGQQKDDEVAGKGNSLEFGLRSYDPRIARFKSVDRMAKALGNQSSYAFANNSPIAAIDFAGALGVFVTKSAQSEGVSGPVLQNFTRVVSNIGSMLEANPAILKKMSEQTGLSKAEIQGWMEYGVGPVITITGQAEGINGIAAARGNTNGIFFAGSLVKDLASYGEDNPLYGAALFQIGMTVLHEATHYGDSKTNGKITGYEEGDNGIQNTPSKFLHRGFDVEFSIIGRANLISFDKDNKGNWSMTKNGSTIQSDPQGLMGLQARLNGGFGGLYNMFKGVVTKFKESDPPADKTVYER